MLRGLEIRRVNQVWATDITYIPMARGCPLLGGHHATGTAVYAGLAAVQHPGGRLLCCGSGRGLEQGSATDPAADQGSQFTSEAFTSMLLVEQGVQVSMDGRGRCMDNVFVVGCGACIKLRKEVYLTRHTKMGLRPERRRIGSRCWPSTSKSGPIKPWAIGHRVRCSMQEPTKVFTGTWPRALPSDEGLRDTPAVAPASPLS